MEVRVTGNRSRILKMIEKRYQESRKEIITILLGEDSPTSDVDITGAYERSRVLLGDYVTLDWDHRREINEIIIKIVKYADDKTLRRPLNIIMQAEPGSGKSHMVKCLAKKLESVDAVAVDCNMTSLRSIEDLAQPLDQVRNLKVVDKLPILFLDEFDSKLDNFAMLLPLLWDGEMHIGHRDLKLGKLVIILAGSGSSIEAAMKQAKSMQTPVGPSDTKLPDLLSRINGGELKIPSLDVVSGQRDRRADKACLTIALLQSRFGDNLEAVPWALLRFIIMSKFRYGVRSIAHIIDLVNSLESGKDKFLSVDDLNLPLGSAAILRQSSLAYHIYSEDGPDEIVELWNVCCKCKSLVRFKEAPIEEEVPF